MGTLMRTGRVEVITAATPSQVWAVLADVTRIGEWSHECREAAWLGDATTATAGARYRGANRVGRVRWSRENEVIAADAPRELVWRTVPSALYRDSTTWRITLDPVSEGTRVAQSFEVTKLNPILERIIHLTVPVHRDRLPALREDLVRLGEVALSVEPASSASAGSS